MLAEAEAHFLTTPEAADLLQEASGLPADPAARSLALRRRHPDLSPARVAALLALLEGRERARRRGFPDAERLFATPDALAQASSPAIARWHAGRLAAFGTVADLGCGIGMDTLALAEAGATVIALEQDPARLHFARANAAVRGVAAQITFLQGDAAAWTGAADALFLDPSRRDPGGARCSRHAERYAPPLSLLADARGRPFVAKLSPALPDDTLDALGTVAFLSETRECKEACILGGDAAVGLPPRSALLLPEEIAIPAGADAPVAGAVDAFLLDPDPALVRAGALADVCRQLGAARIGAEDSYLTASRPPQIARLASAYRIRAAFPYRPALLAAYLRTQGIGRLTVKKRHFPREPEAVQKELGLPRAGVEATLALVAGPERFLALVCDPVGR